MFKVILYEVNDSSYITNARKQASKNISVVFQGNTFKLENFILLILEIYYCSEVQSLDDASLK